MGRASLGAAQLGHLEALLTSLPPVAVPGACGEPNSCLMSGGLDSNTVVGSDFLVAPQVTQPACADGLGEGRGSALLVRGPETVPSDLSVPYG